jgi:hypothetical protein
MFYLGSYYELHDESGRYSHLFWRSLHQSIYLSVCNPRMFDPASHYSFGTNRHFTEISRDEIADITEAMKAARVAFLDNGLSHRSLTTDEHDLRAVLGSVDGRRGRPLHKVRDVADAVLEAVREGNLIFVPLEDDLRDCVKAIQEDRRRRPAQHWQSQPDQFDQRQMYGKPPRLPQNLDTPSYSSGVDALSDAQPFDYRPDALSDNALELAGTDRGDMYACDIIKSECKGSVLREFPSQYLDSTYNEIQGDARDGVKDARKALKLLNDNRFKK